MAGSKTGGKSAAMTNKLKYGFDFYARIGAVGGSRSARGGYWYKKYILGDVESIRRAGMLGGQISRRGKNKTTPKQRREIRRAYKELMAIHLKAKAKRERGLVTVYDRRRGLVREAA